MLAISSSSRTSRRRETSSPASRLHSQSSHTTASAVRCPGDGSLRTERLSRLGRWWLGRDGFMDRGEGSSSSGI